MFHAKKITSKVERKNVRLDNENNLPRLRQYFVSFSEEGAATNKKRTSSILSRLKRDKVDLVRIYPSRKINKVTTTCFHVVVYSSFYQSVEVKVIIQVV